jgi:hypothetical protein
MRMSYLVISCSLFLWVCGMLLAKGQLLDKASWLTMISPSVGRDEQGWKEG